MASSKLNIGGTVIGSLVCLAPMAGYTDFIFRNLVRSHGWPGLAFSEMLNPRSFLTGGGHKRESILATDARDSPLSWQIYGGTSEPMVEAACRLADNGARLIDVNMGCPKRKIMKRGAGSGLLKTDESVLRMLESLAREVPVPVTAKIRIGNDADNILSDSILKRLSETGIAAISIHARTSDQGYSGSAQWQHIARAVSLIDRIPVIGNGDICTPSDAAGMIEQTGCAGVMVGRAALKQPWLLRDIHNRLENVPIPPPPTTAQHVELMLGHFQTVVDRYGEFRAIRIFQRWIPQYCKSLQTGRRTMIALLKTRDPDEFIRLARDTDFLFANTAEQDDEIRLPKQSSL